MLTFSQLPKLVIRDFVSLGERSIPSYSLTFSDISSGDLCSKVSLATLVPTRKGVGACEYLWHDWCSYLSDPLLKGFSHEIEKRLSMAGEEMIYLGLSLLSDYLYDPIIC